MQRFACLLAAVVAVCTATAAQAQEKPAVIKDAAAARTYASYCPGCGYFYTGEVGKGAVVAGVGMAALIAAPFLLLQSNDQEEGMRACERDLFDPACDVDANAVFDTNWTGFIAAAGVGLAAYIYGIVDAPASARRVNEKNGFKVGTVEIAPNVGMTANRSFALGAKLALRRR